MAVKAPKQANANNSTGCKFIQIRMRWFLCVRNPDSCSCSGLVLALSGWYFRLLIVSRHRVKIWGGTCRNLSRSVLEMWYVFVDAFCFRCQKQKKKKKGTAAVLYWFYSGSVEAQMVYLAWVSTCPCSRILLNLVHTYTGSVSRLVEENRPKTRVQWKKMTK